MRSLGKALAWWLPKVCVSIFYYFRSFQLFWSKLDPAGVTIQRSQTILSSITLSELTPGSLVVAEQPLLVLDPPTDRWMILLFLISTMIIKKT